VQFLRIPDLPYASQPTWNALRCKPKALNLRLVKQIRLKNIEMIASISLMHLSPLNSLNLQDILLIRYIDLQTFCLNNNFAFAGNGGRNGGSTVAAMAGTPPNKPA